MKRIVLVILCAVAFAAAPVAAGAATITYVEGLNPSITVHGVNTQLDFSTNDPLGANFYAFFAQQNATVTVRVNRENGAFDPAAWIFRGLFMNTMQFGPNELFDVSDPNFVAYLDDNSPAAIPGPFGDPFGSFVAPISGFYTLAVTNAISNVSVAPNAFALTATGITSLPEPATVSLTGLGALGLLAHAYRRRRDATR